MWGAVAPRGLEFEHHLPGGCFLFSVEEADADQRMQLRASARYAHSQSCITELAAAHGLAVQQIDSRTLRHDQGLPIAGLLVRLARD